MFRKFRLVPYDQAPPVTELPTNPVVATTTNPTIIETKQPQENRFPEPEILDSVDPAIRNKAKSLLAYLEKTTKINPENLKIIYPDSVEGSTLPKLIDWLFSDDNDTKPWDANRFVRFLENVGVPKLYFGKAGDTEANKGPTYMSNWERLW